MKSSLAVLLLSLCQAALAAPKDEALAVLEKWQQAYNRGDSKALSALFTKDALFFGAQGKKLLTSPEDIRKFYKSLKVQPYATQLDKLSVLQVSEDVVVLAGPDGVTAHRGGKDYAFNGRVTFVVVKQATEWKIAHFHRSVMPK